ncbi:MAG: hypothetical protein BMS9Abin26_0996 [Gammaproteobacteria bacterium]|nr:MAG: hypothetical protein BMS9Abin26_0996 [Gammaproteobacteria bacterium]
MKDSIKKICGSLHCQLIILLSIFLVITIALYSWYTISQQRQIVLNLLKDEALLISNDIAFSAASYIIVSNYIALEEELISYVDQGRIKSLQVIDHHGLVISHVIQNEDSNPQVIYGNKSVEPPTKENQTVLAGGDFLETWLPISLDKSIGWVRVTTSLEPITLLVRKIIFNAIIASAIALVFSVLLMFMLLRPRLETIKNMTAFADKLDVGLGSQIPVDHSSAETEALGMALNKASSRLFSAESVTRSSEQQLQAVIQNMPVMMVAFDDENKLVVWNKECSRVTGYDKDQISDDTHILELFFPDVHYREQILDRWHKGQDFINWEIDITSIDGDIHTIAWSNISRQIPVTGWKYWAIGIDITDRKSAEEMARARREELAHALRHATLGELATGIAHEVNQPLSAIINYAKGCQFRLTDHSLDESDYNEALDRIIVQANRAAKIISRLRQFVRKKEPHRSTSDINEIIGYSLDFIESQTRQNNIKLDVHLGKDLPLLLVDPIQIEQVLLNLEINAIESVMETTNGERLITITSAMGVNNKIMVSVQDSGTGLPIEQHDIIFEAFYTTKSLGMGLGLSISRSIIESHEGSMWVKPDGMHKGTTIYFSIPTINEQIK